MSFESRHQCRKIWDRFICTARWHKVKWAFWKSLSTAIGSICGWIHTFFMNLLLQRLTVFIKDILGPMFLYQKLRTVQGDWLDYIYTEQWVVLLAGCCFFFFYSVNGLGVCNCVEMWCGSTWLAFRVELLLCAVPRSTLSRVAVSLDPLVITGTLLTQDTRKNDSTTPENSAQACISPNVRGQSRSHKNRQDFTLQAKCPESCSTRNWWCL